MREEADHGRDRGIADLRDDKDVRAEALSEHAHEAKLLIIWDQDSDARETLERHGLAGVSGVVAALAVRDEIEGGHYDNARRIARRHRVDLEAVARRLARRMRRDGYGDQAEEVARRFDLESLDSPAPPVLAEGRAPRLVPELSGEDERRAAAIAVEHLLRVEDDAGVVSVARAHDLFEPLRRRFAEEVARLMRVTGGHQPTFDVRRSERASRLAEAAGLQGMFRERAQEIAARALVHTTLIDERSEVTATDFAWRTCGMDADRLRTLAPVGLLLSVAPPGFHDDTLALARELEDLADPRVVEKAREALLAYLDREQSPRALSELAGVARSFGEGRLAWRAADKAYERSMALRKELEPAEAAAELEACLELVESFDHGGERTRKVAAACARLWLLSDPLHAAEIARAQGLTALMREAAARHLRAQLDAHDLDGAEETAQRFDLRRERVAEVALEAVEAKIDAGDLLEALRLSRAQGVGEERVRGAALELLDRVGDESRHDELEHALDVAAAAGLTEQARRIASRLFHQRYQFTRMMPSYDYLLETLRFAVERDATGPLARSSVEADGGVELDQDFAEGLVRVLAYHAGRDSLESFRALWREWRLDDAWMGVVIDGYLDRITSERAPWYAAAVRVATTFDRMGWLRDHIDEVVENALVHGAVERAEGLAREHGGRALQGVVARFATLIEESSGRGACQRW